MNNQANNNACWCALEQAKRATVFAHISRHSVFVSGLNHSHYQLTSDEVTALVAHSRCGMNAIATTNSQGCIDDYREVVFMFEEVLQQYDPPATARRKLRASA